MQEACYLFGSHSTQTNNSIRLLHLISCHPSFRNKVNNFLQLLPSLTKDNLVHLGILTMTLMLPNYPAQYHKKIALELFDSLIGYSKVPTLTTLSQYLLKLCSYCVISLDVHSAIGFLSLVESRITNCYVISAVSADCRKQVGFQSNLSFISPEIIIEESGLPESNHRQASQHLYYEEKISFIQNQLKIQADDVLLRELKSNAKQVIPLGYICEHYLHDLINNNFQNKNSYRLQSSKRTILNMKVDYWVTPNEKVIDNLRDEIVNLQTFRSCAVLTHSHIPQKIDPNPIKSYPIALINSTFSHPMYFEKLKHLESHQLKYFNILSDYYERDEFSIDELTLTREKLISRRKQHLLGMNTKQTIRKEDKDYQEQVLKLGLNISRQQNLKEDAKRTNATVQQLSGLLREQLQQDKNINKYLEKYLSEQFSIRTDPQHTFSSDIIQQASIIPLQLMLIGRPKSGKSTLSKLIAQHYKLVYISIESMVDKIFERMKYFEQNPPQPDEDGNIKQGLLAIQKCIIEDIAQGKCSDNEDILDLINNQLTKPFTKSRGFILDLPFEYDRFWIDNLISNRIEMPKIGCRFITHMIVIDQTEDQWKYFTSSLMQKPQQLTISSNLDRYLMVKPKTINNEEEGDLQGEQEEEEKIQPLNSKNLIKLKCKDSYYTLMEHMSQHMHHNRIIKIKNAYQSPSQCLQTLNYYLYSIPIAKKIEGSEKELLTVGLEEIQMIRKWSPWGIIDCIQLHRNKLIAGKSQFAAEYAGRNLTQFIDNPRPYLSKLPCIPDKTNICITGPRKSGKKTIAKLLSSIYGWKVIDFQYIIQTVIKRQKSFEMPVPSNPAKRSKSVHLSQPEFKQFTKGNLLNSKDVLPIILYWLGVVLQKKPIGWGVQKDEQGGVNTGEEQKKPVPKKGKKKEKVVEDERPKTPPLQDLNLKDIIPEINHFGKLDEIKGYILIGYPNNEQQLAAMKNFNIPIDKMILLNDNNEQNPNKILQTRLNDAELEQVSGFMTMIGGVKDALGEQICKEVSINNTPEEMINKIRQIIDPFYLKCDDDSLNRVCADKQEQGDPIAMGYCSDYCPVVLQEGWLIKGKDQFQAGVEGKRFKFLTEKQQNEFKQNPKKYLEFNKNIPPPRIMFMGVRGVGLTTQLLKLNQKYKIPILNIKDTLLQKLENQTNQRKMQRYYKKGFKKPQVDEQGNVVEDTELNEQSPDFDKKNEEIKLIQRIFQGIEEIFINGNFYDVEQEKVSTGIVQLLAEAKRLPQLVITLTCQESQWLQRVMNKKEIEQQLQKIKTKRKMEKQKEREEAKQQAKKKAEEDGEQYQQPAQIEEEEDDPEIPKLEDMITQKEQELKTRREADNTRMEELTETFKTYNVEVVSVSCERQAKHVTDRINHVIKPIIEDRLNKLSRSSMLSIERQRVPHFLDNYCALDSRFGKANPFTFMINPLPYPLLYNDRIYYLKDEEERQLVLRNPQSLKLNQAVPHDVYISPIIFVIGHTKTGKSTLAQNISKKMGLILIDLKQIGEMWTTEHCNLEVNDIKTVIKDGKVLSDEAIITLIRKRASMRDCLSRGWILDGFPNNTNQCQLLNKSGIEPLVVFQLKMTELQIKQRVIKSNLGNQHYDFDMQVIHDRIKNYKKSLFEVQSYYWNRFNNIQSLNAKLSKWGLVELVTKQIQKRYKYKKNMILNLAIHNAIDLSTIRLNFNCILNNLSEYQNYCPVSYKIKRQFINLCIKHHQHLSLFNKKIYIFKTQKELKDFLNNPDTFIKLNHPLNAPKQVQLKEISKSMMKVQNEEYCMVELKNNKLIKGNSLWCIQQNNKYYLTSTAIRMKQYLMNPSYYQLAKLPDKLPVQFEKKNDLKKIARRNDCAAFLEHHLSVIMMKSLAQLGYRRPKYPTLGSKQSALKFLAISLKASNPNKDEEYRRKYTEKLTKFIKQCNYSQEIRDELNRKQKKTWQNYDEQNLLKLSQEYSSFLKVLQNQDKMKYFSDFIR